MLYTVFGMIYATIHVTTIKIEREYADSGINQTQNSFITLRPEGGNHIEPVTDWHQDRKMDGGEKPANNSIKLFTTVIYKCRY